MDFSTEEQAVGKWIDGKTIYRKCFYVPGILAAESYLEIGSKIEGIISVSGWGKDNSGNIYSFPYSDSSGNFVTVFVYSENNHALRVAGSGMPNGFRDLNMFVDYVKS